MVNWRLWAEKIEEDYRAENVLLQEIPGIVLRVLTEENADEVISSLSGAPRESFLEWARYLSFSGDDELISFTSVDGKLNAEQKQRVRVVRDWVQAHPMPERSEPLPVDPMRGLLSRVDHENRRLISLIQKDRRHPERARRDRATSVCADIQNALEVAAKHPINPQAQAFAWYLLDRALRDVDGLIEVTETEQRLIDHQRRVHPASE